MLASLMGSADEVTDVQNAFSGSISHGGAGFRVLNRLKYALVRQLLSWGFHVLSLDNDVALVGDPIPWLAQHVLGVVDLAIQLDDLALRDGSEHVLDGLTRLDVGGLPIGCVGIMFISPAPRILDLFDAWLAKMRETDKLDQIVLHNVMMEGNVRILPQNPRVARVAYSVTVGALPVTRFSNGHIYKIQRLPQRLGIQPLAVHATFDYAGSHGKTTSLRELGLWVNEPDYYAGSFLSFDIDYSSIPAPNVTRLLGLQAGEFPVDHMLFIGHQLDQVGDALALANRLGRTLILPPLLCACTRYFHFLPRCVPKGVDPISLPNVCSTADVLALNAWAERGIPWREHTFLSSPDTPRALKEDKIVLRLVPSKALARTTDPPRHLIHEVEPLDLAQDSFAADLLKPPYASRKVLHLAPGVVSRIGRLNPSDPRSEWPFTCAEASLFGRWCCSKQSSTLYRPLLGDLCPGKAGEEGNAFHPKDSRVITE